MIAVGRDIKEMTDNNNGAREDAETAVKAA